MHDHACPECSHQFTCDVPFCWDMHRMHCDECLDTSTKIVPHPDGGYQQVVDYVREREVTG